MYPIQGSMSSMAGSLAATATTLESALGLFAIASSWSGLGAVFFEAAGVFVGAATAIGETALNTASGDSGLRDDLICAIYTAIVADGHVTTANLPTVISNISAISYATPGIVGMIADYVSNLGYAGINAIQSEGTLYDGDCSACGTWCWEFDFTVASTGAVANTGQGTWVSGQGWTSIHSGGNTLLYLLIDLPGTATYLITEVDVDYSTAAAMGSGAGIARDVQVEPDATLFALDTGAWPSGHIEHRTIGVSGTQVDIRLMSLGTAGNNIIKRVQISGVGANPFGPDNCTF